MTSRKARKFQCNVVDESVLIALRRKPSAGLNSKHVFFVQCDQSECQYVDANESPCPLNLSLFAEEIRAREEDSRQRRQDY